MKKVIVAFALFQLLMQVETNAQDWVLSNKIKGTYIEPKFSAIDNQNSSVVLASYTDTIYAPYYNVAQGVAPYPPDLFLFKVNSAGVITWSKSIGSNGNEFAGGVAVDNSNNIYVAGNFNNLCYFTAADTLRSGGKADIFIAKYNPSGTLQWVRRVATGAEIQYAMDMKFDPSGKLVMTGYYRDNMVIGLAQPNLDTLTGGAIFTHFVAAFDMEATYLWSKKYGATNNLTRFAKIAIVDDGYAIGGYYQGSVYFDIDTITSSPLTSYDNFIYKINTGGESEWLRKIRGSNTENFRSLTSDEYNNIYVLGNYTSASILVDSTENTFKTYTGNTGGYDTYIGKYNRSGILQWFLRKGGSSRDAYLDFAMRNNIIYATGYFANQIIFNNDTLKSSSATNEDAFIAAFNEIGDPIAGVSVQGTGDKRDAGVVVNIDGGARAFISGYYLSSQIIIADSTYTSSNVDKPDLFYAYYQHPFKAVITGEKMVSCYGLSDGRLEVTPYFGIPPYTYKWSHNPALNQNFAADLAPGEYTATIIDGDLDTAMITTTVTQPATLAIADTITQPFCFNESNGSIDITVTGGTAAEGYSYAWTTEGGSGVSPTQQDQSGISEGLYFVLVTDDNECTVLDTFQVDQPMPISFMGSTVIDVIDPPGNNGSVIPVVSGGTSPFEFAWSGPGGYVSSEDTIEDISGGNYLLVVTDDNSCSGDTTFLVYEAGLLIAQVSIKTDVTCYGDDDGTAVITMLNGTPPFTYKWSDQAPFPSSDTFNIRTGMSPGNYFITVTDNASHTSSTQVKINGPSSELILSTDPTDLRCYHDSSGVIDLTITGGTLPYRFQWSNGSTGEDLVGCAKGTFTVIVTDTNGCSANEEATVNEPDLFVVTISEDTSLYCFGDKNGALTAHPVGGALPYTSYSWNDPGNQSTPTARGLTARKYTVTLTDQNGCEAITEHDLLQPAILNPGSTHLDISCTGADDGLITADVTGGTMPYNYIWSNRATTPIISNLAPGIYGLKVIDAFNCKDSSLSVTITEPNVISITSQAADSNTITIAAGGGTPPLTYSLNGGSPQSSGVFSSLPNGTYTVEVNDANDCGPVLSEEFIIDISAIETDDMASFTVFPNPSDGKFNLSFESELQPVFIEVLNITGVVIYNTEITSAQRKTNYLLDLSAFPKGMYLMRINRKAVRERLIIN